MTRTTTPTTIYLLAGLLVLVGQTRRTAHGAHRVNLGRHRFHVDADGVVIWKAGGPRILATLTHPGPEAKPSPRTAAAPAPARPIFATLPAPDRPYLLAYSTAAGWVHCRVERNAGHITGPTGTHSVYTGPGTAGPERLAIHLRGYLENNGGHTPLTTTTPSWAPVARTYPRPVSMTVGA